LIGESSEIPAGPQAARESGSASSDLLIADERVNEFEF